MEIMGWSETSVARRYRHVPHELVAAIADQVGDLVWTVPTDQAGDGAATDEELTDGQRDAISRLASALPEPGGQRLAELLRDDGEGPAGALVPAPAGGQLRPKLRP